ncbi:MAG: hypothetical protein VX500_07955, partial [Planctomycetota bacterium]|nr:hypothetical protein [Planctomycetota bacterium]
MSEDNGESGLESVSHGPDKAASNSKLHLLDYDSESRATWLKTQGSQSYRAKQIRQRQFSRRAESFEDKPDHP